MQFTPAALAALASVASAQTVHVVTVSSTNNSLAYLPDAIKANVGDMVQFQFVGGNHTVTQSTFDQPCMPIQQVLSNVTGFHSGFMPVAASADTGLLPTYTISVKDTKPMWAYCAQGKHCQAGMVMVINENTAANQTRSLAEFKKIAALQTANIAPGSAAGSNSGSGSNAGSGNANVGSGSGSGTGSNSGANNTNPNSPSTTGSGSAPGNTGPAVAGSSMVQVGSSLGLAAAAAAVMLLL